MNKVYFVKPRSLYQFWFSHTLLSEYSTSLLIQGALELEYPTWDRTVTKLTARNQQKWLRNYPNSNFRKTIYFQKFVFSAFFGKTIKLDDFNPKMEKNPKRGTITECVLRKKIQSSAMNQFLYVSVLWIFFVDGPKKWHIFFFSEAYLPSYWHMPFEISIIR